MTRETIVKTIADIARDELAWTEPLPQGNLVEHLDSVDRLSLVVALEDHFQICLDPEDEERIATLDDLVTCIGHKLASSEPLNAQV